MPKPRVKLVACASNEAGYLAQWVYHHFYFGFDSIEIVVNRTSDNTNEVIDRLKTIYPRLKVTYFDWLDLEMRRANKYFSLQTLAYHHVYFNSQHDCDYLLFIDIDEYYMPFNCRDNVGDFVEALGRPDAIALEWFNTGIQKYPLVPYLSAHDYLCKWKPQTKTMVRTGLTFTGMSAHMIKFDNIDSYVMADGNPVRIPVPVSHTLLQECFTGFKQAFILHDFGRSVINYLSGIARGSVWRPECNSAKTLYADREPPWPFYGNNSYLKFINRLPDDYHRGFARMFRGLDLEGQFREAMIHQALYALESLRYMQLDPESPLAMKIKENFCSLEQLREQILEELDVWGYPAAGLKDCQILEPGQIDQSNPDQARKDFEKVIRLYPFAKNESSEPLFLKEYLMFLTGQKEFDKALALLNDETLIAIKTFGMDWAIPWLAAGYEKSGDREKAFYWYDKRYYSNSVWSFNKWKELKPA